MNTRASPYGDELPYQSRYRDAGRPWQSSLTKFLDESNGKKISINELLYEPAISDMNLAYLFLSSLTVILSRSKH